jgi:hypothetical protein
MKQTIKTLSERMDVLEKRIDIMMSMVNHMNNILAENTIQKIEIDFEEAVNKKIEFMKNESNENSL